MKKRIKLNERQLRDIIAESVKNVLKKIIITEIKLLNYYNLMAQ